MLVSAISIHDKGSYNITNSSKLSNVRNSDFINDTSFNSLSPYVNKRNSSSEENSQIVLDSINQWKNFCEHHVLGEKLDVIA